MAVAVAEEGFWPYSAPPVAQIKKQYGVELTPQWLQHLMKSSAKLGDGSGSFVSEDGLFLTNYHVAMPVTVKLDDAGKQRVQKGFLARQLGEELRIPGAIIEVVRSIEDVTSKVEGVVPKNAKKEHEAAARARAAAKIQKECMRKDTESCVVVALAGGARYELHRYRRYTDVRLVFCPSSSTAFFHWMANEPSTDYLDAFNFDICFFRAYERGVPARMEHYLKWSAQPLQEGELVFGSGFPHPAPRHLAIGRLEYRRDFELPRAIDVQSRLISAYSDLLSRSKTASAEVQQGLQGAKNYLSLLQMDLAVLQDPAWMHQRRTEDEELRARLEEAGEHEVIGAYDRLDDALAVLRKHSTRYALIEDSPGFGAIALRYADSMLTVAREIVKPEAKRDPVFREPRWGRFMDWLSGDLFETSSSELEQATLTAWFTALAESLGTNDPFVLNVLGGQTPAAAAARMVQGSQVGNIQFHKALLGGDPATVAAAIERSTDPLIVLARRVKAESEGFADVEHANQMADAAEVELSRARYRVFADVDYPDTTDSLRLGYGTVQGYEYAGRRFPAWSRFEDFNRWLTEHAEQRARLPKNWDAARDHLSSETPFNLIATLDILGGNSGTPLVNRSGEFIGVAHAMAPSKYPLGVYNPDGSRALAIAGSGIVEVLRKIYQDDSLTGELISGHRPADARRTAALPKAPHTDR